MPMQVYHWIALLASYSLDYVSENITGKRFENFAYLRLLRSNLAKILTTGPLILGGQNVPFSKNKFFHANFSGWNEIVKD